MPWTLRPSILISAWDGHECDLGVTSELRISGERCRAWIRGLMFVSGGKQADPAAYYWHRPDNEWWYMIETHMDGLEGTPDSTKRRLLSAHLAEMRKRQHLNEVANSSKGLRPNSHRSGTMKSRSWQMAFIEKRAKNRWRARYRGPDGRERSLHLRTQERRRTLPDLHRAREVDRRIR